LDSPLTHTIVGLHALAILIDPPRTSCGTLFTLFKDPSNRGVSEYGTVKVEERRWDIFLPN